MTDKNTILAIVLSAIVLIAWQYFIGLPQMNKQKQVAQQQQQEQVQKPAEKTQTPAGKTPEQAASSQTPSAQAPSGAPQAPGQSAVPASPQQSREAALAAVPRVTIETPTLRGSIALKGGRIDDLSLVKFRQTVNPNSPPIILLSPSGSPHPFYAEFGWVGGAKTKMPLPDANTLWKQQGSGPLTVNHPVTLVYDNGDGLTFHRTISVDNKYLFTIKDVVTNNGKTAATIYPYALISRHGTPKTLGYYLLHEGLIGELGSDGLQEITYSKIKDKKSMSFNVTNAWLGFTDKYWAATLIPETTAHLHARFSATKLGKIETYQTDYLENERTLAPGASTTADTRLFAGAKEVHTINYYEEHLHLNHFDLMIDWGWFYFITKPVFYALDWIYGQVGNFGLAIMILTVCIKILFFPLANKSYASMAKMKAVQPQMQVLKERYPDDKMKQQQELMELYKKEKINPLAGCLPIAIQIPVFFALYKVLFITIEMRHAPFFGWIHDLSVPDPTNIFTLFGLLHYDPSTIPFVGHFLFLGIWPLIMGVTMWMQMKLNPTPPDPTQAMIFNWMPVIFTFMLARFPAGLVIYWSWNNTLSVIQQSVIMKRNGAKVELFDNIKNLFVKKAQQNPRS